MSILCPAQVTSRANSQMCAVDRIIANRAMSSAARMELLASQVDEWRANVTGTTGQLIAQREAGIRPPQS